MRKGPQQAQERSKNTIESTQLNPWAWTFNDFLLVGLVRAPWALPLQAICHGLSIYKRQSVCAYSTFVRNLL